MTLLPGTRLGPSEVIALIGAGGMSEVYQARDTRLDRRSSSGSTLNGKDGPPTRAPLETPGPSGD
jgi:serine/threonine protein kinase